MWLGSGIGARSDVWAPLCSPLPLLLLLLLLLLLPATDAEASRSWYASADRVPMIGTPPVGAGSAGIAGARDGSCVAVWAPAAEPYCCGGCVLYACAGGIGGGAALVRALVLARGGSGGGGAGTGGPVCVAYVSCVGDGAGDGAGDGEAYTGASGAGAAGAEGTGGGGGMTTAEDGAGGATGA